MLRDDYSQSDMRERTGKKLVFEEVNMYKVQI